MMPYNNFFQNQQQQFFPQMQQQQSSQAMQIQNSGFISVRSESEAFNYPVAPGNCVTFKVEGQPIVLEKSMGFSQLEAPKFERYRLVKEDASETLKMPQIEPQDSKAVESMVNDLKAEIEQIWANIDDIKSNLKPQTKKTVGRTKNDDSE